MGAIPTRVRLRGPPANARALRSPAAFTGTESGSRCRPEPERRGTMPVAQVKAAGAYRRPVKQSLPRSPPAPGASGVRAARFPVLAPANADSMALAHATVPASEGTTRRRRRRRLWRAPPSARDRARRRRSVKATRAFGTTVAGNPAARRAPPAGPRMPRPAPQDPAPWRPGLVAGDTRVRGAARDLPGRLPIMTSPLAQAEPACEIPPRSSAASTATRAPFLNRSDGPRSASVPRIEPYRVMQFRPGATQPAVVFDLPAGSDFTLSPGGRARYTCRLNRREYNAAAHRAADSVAPGGVSRGSATSQSGMGGRLRAVRRHRLRRCSIRARRREGGQRRRWTVTTA